MNNQIETIELNIKILKIRKPQGIINPRVSLLLHGWTGDENSMWVFSQAFPETDFLIAPRAPFQSTHSHRGGFPVFLKSRK